MMKRGGGSGKMHFKCIVSTYVAYDTGGRDWDSRNDKQHGNGLLCCQVDKQAVHFASRHIGSIGCDCHWSNDG